MQTTMPVSLGARIAALVVALAVVVAIPPGAAIAPAWAQAADDKLPPNDAPTAPSKKPKVDSGPCAQFLAGSAEYKDCSARVKTDSDRRRLGECAQYAAGTVDRQRCLQARSHAGRLPCDEFKAGTPERSQCLDRLGAAEESKRSGDCGQFAAESGERRACLAKQRPNR